MKYYVQAYGDKRDYPPHVGQQFWFCLSQKCSDKNQHPLTYYTKTPIMTDRGDLYVCPATSSSEGTCNYLGPKKHTPEGKPSALADGFPPDTPIAADMRGNHKDGGNVLFFDGRVQFLTGEEYEKALKELE